MRLVKALLSVALTCLLLLSSGCLSEDEAPTIKVALDVMGEQDQNVVQGNNTTFILAIENNWKENATLVMSIEGVPKDWGHSFVPGSVVLEKNTGSAIMLNLSVPEDEDNRGFSMKVQVKAQGSDVHKRSRRVTVFVLDSEISPQLDVVGPGDTVYVNYTGLLLDGSVFDTTNEDIAEDFRIKKEDSFQARGIYDPQPFHPDSGELVEGFDEGFSNMRKGETKSFFVPDTKAYSIYKEVTLNLTEVVPMREEWSTTEFQRAFNQDPAMWLVVTHRKWNWTAQVVSIADDESRTVTIELLVSPGDNTTTYGWESVVISVDSSANGGAGEIILRHSPEAGGAAQLYNSTAPKEYDFGKVVELTETQVTVRVQASHHPLAGKDLIFVVKIHDFAE